MAPSRPCAFARCNFPHVTMDDLPPSPYRRAPSKEPPYLIGFRPPPSAEMMFTWT